MKVLIVTHYFAPHHGGIEVVAASQAKYLAAAGHQVQVLTSAAGKSLAGSEDHVDGYKIQRVDANNFLENKTGVPFPIFSLAIFWQSYKLTKEAEVVHVHDAFYISSLASTLFARLHKKPVVLTQHVDMIPHPSAAVRLIQKLVYATSGNFVFRSSAKIIVLNSRVKNFLIARNIDATKIVFLPNGVDINIFAPATADQKRELRKKYNLPQDRLLALFLGRFVPKKGFTKLRNMQAINDLDIVFAGGNTPEHVTRPDHHFLGFVSRKDAPDVFKMCDLFVMPSEGEGFPITVQEAMASGLCVITADDPAYDVYQLNHDLIAFTKPETEEVAAALEALLRSDNRRNEMRKYSREYAAQNFGHNVNLQSMVRIYKEVAA